MPEPLPAETNKPEKSSPKKEGVPGPRPGREPFQAEIKHEALRRWNHRCAVCGDHRMQVHHINGCNWDSHREQNLLPLCANCHLEDVEYEHGITEWMGFDLRERLCLLQRTQNPFVLDYRFNPLWQRMKVLRMLAPSGILSGKQYHAWHKKGFTRVSKKKGAGSHSKAWFKHIGDEFSQAFGSAQKAWLQEAGTNEVQGLSSFAMRDLISHVATFDRGHFYAARVRSALVYTESNWDSFERMRKSRDPSYTQKDKNVPAASDDQKHKDAMFNEIDSLEGKRRRMVEDLVAEMLLYQGWERPKSLNSLIPVP